MASKRPPPLDDPPSASSDEDDETEDEQEQEQEIITQKTIQQPSESESEDEEEEEESDSEEKTPPLLKKPPVSKSSSEEEEESESEEEETQTPTPKSSSIFEFESEIKSPSVSNFSIKPSKKITSFSTPEKKQVLKRPSLASDLKNKKKVKVSNGDVVNDDEKKLSVNKRVWSEEDELMLLQGFIDYQSKNGCSPSSDMDGFYQFTMDFLPGNASKSQLYEKIRRLKKKFRVNEEKVTATGEDPVFIKPHERKLFEVSKTIWGVNGCETVGNANGSNVKTKARSVKPKPKAEGKVEKAKVGKAVEVVDDEMLVEVKDFETLYPYWNAGLNLGDSSSLNFPKGIVGLFREELSLIDEATATEMNEKWKAHFENEAVLQKKKIALLNKVSNLSGV